MKKFGHKSHISGTKRFFSTKKTKSKIQDMLQENAKKLEKKYCKP